MLRADRRSQLSQCSNHLVQCTGSGRTHHLAVEAMHDVAEKSALALAAFDLRRARAGRADRLRPPTGDRRGGIRRVDRCPARGDSRQRAPATAVSVPRREGIPDGRNMAPRSIQRDAGTRPHRSRRTNASLALQWTWRFPSKRGVRHVGIRCSGRAASARHHCSRCGTCVISAGKSLRFPALQYRGVRLRDVSAQCVGHFSRVACGVKSGVAP